MGNEELLKKLNDLLLEFDKNSEDLKTCFDIGQIYASLRNHQDAINFYKKALVINPDETGIHLNIGVSYSELGDFDSSLFHYQQILNCDEYSERFLKIKAGAFLNIANILYFKNEFDKSIDILEEALKFFPDYLDIYVNLGNCYNGKRQSEKAIYYFKKALGLDSNDLDARHNLASTQLSIGDFKNGFENYEYRIFAPKETITTEYLTFEKPLWKGENLDGKTIFIYHEQGLGDAIQFVRFFNDFRLKRAKIIYNPPAILFELFKNSRFNAELVPFDYHKTMKDFESKFDYYLPLMSLPYVLNLNSDEIPFDGPYIFPDERRIQKFKEFFEKDKNKIKIGINWKGNPNGEPSRVIKLKEFFTLCDIENVSFYSFQKGSGYEELEDLPSNINIINLGQYLSDFSDTAAALIYIDMLISNDSSMVHLGGAMGVPTWVMIPYFPEWRWGLESDTSFWYDSVRLFRQKNIGNWSEVFQDVKKELLDISALNEKLKV